MAQFITLNSPQNFQNASIRPFKQILYTLRDGKLVFTPEDSSDSKSISDNSRSVSSEGFRVVDNHDQDEVYIEIFRENNEKSVLGIIDNKLITSISSAYEAFFEDDFEERIRRQSCVVCGKVFLTLQQLLHHLQYLHKISYPEECFICHKYFENTTQKVEHLFEDHALNEPDLVCEVCFQKFSSQYDKEIHRLCHESAIKCQWCEESFPCKFLLSSHLHHCLHRRSDLECHICGCNFRSSQMLQLHNLRHRRTACDICHHDIMNKAEITLESTEVVLIRHLKSTHSPEEINRNLLLLKKQDEEEIFLEKMLMNQIQANLNTCNDSFISGCHNPVNEELLDITPNGSVLEQGLQTQDEITRHTSKQSNNFGKQQDLLICSMCSCTFETESMMKKHEEMHTVINFQCSDCRKDFGTKEELLKHTLNHQNPFSCDVCLLKFPHRRGFKKHMRSHGILVKPENIRYKCNMCTVNCPTMSSLRIHLLTHTDHKQYLCDKCGLRFRRPRALKAHDLAVHKPRALHYCPHCENSSYSKTSLLRHVQCVHGGVRRFICGLCSARCFQNQDLRKHLKAMHNIGLPPMDSLCKKSTGEIHVLPPADNLCPTDPLAHLLQTAIREEQSKLEALKLQQIAPPINAESHLHLPSSELLLDNRQSLNILGDVASKAAPLKHVGSTSSLPQQLIDLESQKTSKLLCGVCQYSCNSLEALSSHFAQCYPKKSLLQANLLKDEVSAASSKSLMVYSLAPTCSPSLSSSAAPCARGVPFQFCILPSTNVESMSLESGLGSGSIISNDIVSSFLSAPNLGSTSLLPTSCTVQLSNNTSACSSSVNNLDNTTGVELTAEPESVNCVATSYSDESRAIFHAMASNTLDSSKSCQVDSLNQSKDTSSCFPICVHNLTVRDSRVECNVSSSLSTYVPQMKSYLSSGGALENSLREEDCLTSNINQKNTSTMQISYPELACSIKLNQMISEEDGNVKFNFMCDHPKALEIPNEDFPFWSASSQTVVTEAVSSDLGSLKDTNNDIGAAVSVVDIGCVEDCLLSYPIVDVEPTSDVNEEFSKSSSNELQSVGVFSKPNGFDNSDLSQTENVNLSSTMLKNGTKTCPECGKQLSCSSNYKRHLQIHLDDKPHKCLYCGKGFRYKCNLTVHMRTHTGARPYECPICKRNFRYQTEYREHKQLHEGSKSYKCLDCGQLFARQRDLNRHSLHHRRKSKPTCHVCQKSFSRMDYLKRHIKSHGKLEEIDNDGFEEHSATISQDATLCLPLIGTGNLSTKSRTPYACKLCSLLIASETEIKVHKKKCMGKQKGKDDSNLESEKNLPQDSLKIDFSVSSNPGTLPSSSEDLISIALQAAEDGVEFMFVEGLKPTPKQPQDDSPDNTIYVQLLDQNQRNV